MSTVNQITGGLFQTITGTPIAGGRIRLQLNEDVTNLGIIRSLGIASGGTLEFDLDQNGNVVTSPPSFVWPNDVLTPKTSFYTVTVYSADGALVWGPNPQQVVSTPSPFNIGTWVPGQIVNRFV